MTIVADITKEEIIEAYKEVFPDSIISVNRGCLGRDLYGTAILANSKDECSNGYTTNDPLGYRFCIDVHLNLYKDEGPMVSIAPPKDSYLAFGRDKIRGKTIKNITKVKLIKRFEQVKQLVIDNKDNFIQLHFDIENKIK